MKKNKNQLMYNLMVLPGVLILLIFNYIPMLGLVIAFQDYRYNLGVLKSPFIGFKNFEFFFKSQDAGRVLFNTIVLNFSYIVLGIVAAVFLALMLYRIKRKAAIKGYQTMMMLPYFLSWVVVGCMAYGFLNPTSGIINCILKYIGLEGIDWYARPKYWPFILGFFSIWKNIGINCIIYYAGLLGTDEALFEAAELDGANKFQKTVHIAVPAIIPLITTMTLLALGNIFRSDFGLFYQVTRDIGKLYSTTDVIDTYIFRALKSNGDVGMSAAVGFFQSVVGFVTIMIANAVVRKVERENALF